MGKRRLLLPLASLALFACIGKGASKPTGEGGSNPPTDTAVCATCQQRAGGETADFGAAPGGGEICASVEAPLTAEVEQSFELDPLRTFLASPRLVVAEPRRILPGQPQLEGPLEIAFQFEVGAFTYRMGEDCNAVWAPVKVTADVGDGLLSFSTTGVVWKQAGQLHAHLYASADLATATGTYRPQVDTSRPHVGQVEVSMYVYPDQLRGSVLPELIYFESEEQAARYLSGDAWAYGDLDTLVDLDFPVDDCADSEWPLSPDVALELLGGRSPDQLRRDVAERIKSLTTVNAVWRDDSATTVKAELSESPAGTVCASSDDTQRDSGFSGPELTLVMPVMASLRTEDGKIDMPLDQLSIAIGRERNELRWAMLRGLVARAPGEQLDGWIRYAFANNAVDAGGIVQFWREVTPGASTGFDCVAFPPGGKWDTDQCRYRR